MSNIRYNEEQEAFELPYKLWGSMITVRFYTDSEDDIMNNLSDIAVKLETVNGGKKKIAQIAADEGYYEGSAETLAKNIILKNIYVDIDEDEIVVVFDISSKDGYMKTLAVELYDGEFEVTGIA
ncbi:MAG: hypothetical protein K2N49_02565 [Ruminococcus sp.]|nr:hypothetical protein [Ruminococcus sp.]MDE7225728.1 hypothetical protein [Ruminococcus sp.]